MNVFNIPTNCKDCQGHYKRNGAHCCAIYDRALLYNQSNKTVYKCPECASHTVIVDDPWKKDIDIEMARSNYCTGACSGGILSCRWNDGSNNRCMYYNEPLIRQPNRVSVKCNRCLYNSEKAVQSWNADAAKALCDLPIYISMACLICTIVVVISDFIYMTWG